MQRISMPLLRNGQQQETMLSTRLKAKERPLIDLTEKVAILLNAEVVAVGRVPVRKAQKENVDPVLGRPATGKTEPASEQPAVKKEQERMAREGTTRDHRAVFGTAPSSGNGVADRPFKKFDGLVFKPVVPPSRARKATATNVDVEPKMTDVSVEDNDEAVGPTAAA
ncbi:hypothetical protein BG015_005219, partial [Linnemannia schmuckeri]